MAIDKSIIGKTGKPFTMPIEWSKVREFARAIRDPNPVYFDPELAKKECAGIPVPPTFLQVAAFWQDGDSMPTANFDLRRILHGEQEFIYHGGDWPHAGDVLIGEGVISDVYEKPKSDGGKLEFYVTETTWSSERTSRPVVTTKFTLAINCKADAAEPKPLS